MDAVESAVRCMEDNPIFNAGHGSVPTEENTAELDAFIMNGTNLAMGRKSCNFFLEFQLLIKSEQNEPGWVWSHMTQYL